MERKKDTKQKLAFLTEWLAASIPAIRITA